MNLLKRQPIKFKYDKESDTYSIVLSESHLTDKVIKLAITLTCTQKEQLEKESNLEKELINNVGYSIYLPSELSVE